MLSRLIIAALILWVVRVSATSSDEPNKPLDMDAARNAKSEEIRKYMNQSADPCESFFEFACGNWRTHHPTNTSVFQTRAFITAMRQFSRKLPQLLTTLDDLDTASESERKANNFYESCMSSASITEADYIDKLKCIVSEFGQMPALEGDKWQAQDFDWLKTVAEISFKYGVRIILGYSILQDKDDHTAYYMLLTGDGFKYKSTKEILGILTKILKLEDQMAEEVATDILDFNSILYEVSGNTAKTMDGCDGMSMEDLYEKYLPDFDVMKLFNISFGSIPTGKIYRSCNYLESLGGIMKKTPKKVVANYIFFNLLQNFIDYNPADIQELENSCVRQTEVYFKKVVSYLLYRSYDLKNEEDNVAHIWEGIKTTFQMILESSSLSWFDDASREYALEKLHSVQLAVPSYKEINLDEEYAQLTINKRDYIENIKSLEAFKAAQNRATLNAAPQHIDSGLVMYTPVYLYLANTIVIPVAVLQNDFFYSKLYPNVLHLAHLGFTLGHEAVHGFSGNGRTYNRLGDFTGDWEEAIESEYDDRRECLYDQYHSYSYGGTRLPQTKSQSENAADAGGILLAYETYRRWYEDERRTEQELDLETMPTLNYTTYQLFFIYYAQNWCADTHATMRTHVARSGTHSPDEFRAFVPLTNFGEFSNAFECPEGSAMNPAKKCAIY